MKLPLTFCSVLALAAAAPALERHGDLGRDLATAGPVAVTETWDRLRSDSAFHAVLWITEWPRSAVYPGFLTPLVALLALAAALLVRKRS